MVYFWLDRRQYSGSLSWDVRVTSLLFTRTPDCRDSVGGRRGGLLRTPLVAGIHDLRNETGRTAWHLPNDFTETAINAVHTQGLLRHNNPVPRSVYATGERRRSSWRSVWLHCQTASTMVHEVTPLPSHGARLWFYRTPARPVETFRTFPLVFWS
jgi:hypothetical protein